MSRRVKVAFVAVAVAAAVVAAGTFTLGDAPKTSGMAADAAVAEAKQTFTYRVSAVNAVGEGPKSNAISVTATPLTDFQTFVKDAQAAAYYGKWAHDNPGELSRWTAYRDGILASGQPAKPSMLTAYGRSLVDAGVLFLDWALS